MPAARPDAATAACAAPFAAGGGDDVALGFLAPCALGAFADGGAGGDDADGAGDAGVGVEGGDDAGGGVVGAAAPDELGDGGEAGGGDGDDGGGLAGAGDVGGGAVDEAGGGDGAVAVAVPLRLARTMTMSFSPARQLASTPLMKKKAPARSSVKTVLPSANFWSNDDVLHAL
uniref:Uncharacterized protein n=1 Tax=Oryza sativa subsp. japonica TaxID=39947 RepID=Q6H7T3_ORYSJ|nr:hypothetical protein [Oryza sativa Japonica Group]